MKKPLSLTILFCLLLLPLACVQRSFNSPIQPQVLSPTATSTPGVYSTSVPSLLCTITPVATTVTVTESEPATVTGLDDSVGTAQNLGTLGTQVVFVSGTLAGTSSTPDNDYYSFTAGTTGTWNIYLDCYLSPPSPVLYVYDSTQTLIGTYSQNPNIACAFPATSGQTYYFRVYGYGGAAYTAKIFHP